MDEHNTTDGDKVEITLKGSSRAISEILTGNVTRILEDKLDVQRDLDQARSDSGKAHDKMWEAEDRARRAERSENYAKGEQDRLVKLVQERNAELADLTRSNASLRAEVKSLNEQVAVELTDEQFAKLAQERENLFQSLLSAVVFPDNKPKPKTLNELMSFFVFPIFQNGAQRDGTYVVGCANKIQMIKEVRILTGAGLKEAKDFIEGLKGSL